MKKGLIDLHIHSKYSGENIIVDASTILRLALANGVQTLSITDHNTTAGCREALECIKRNKEEFKDLKFIPGVELSCDTVSVDSYREKDKTIRSTISGGVHLLGYGIDPYNPRFIELEKYYSNDIGKRTLGICKFIYRYFGLKVDKSQIRYVINLQDTDCNNLLVRCLGLGEKAHFKNKHDYFKFWHNNVTIDAENYSAFKKACDQCLNALSEELDGFAKQDIYEMIDLIESAGGVAVLAHPTLYRPKMELAKSDFSLMSMLAERLTIPVNKFTEEPMRGIVGFEMLHGRSMDEQFKYKFFDNIIKEKGFYVTGGSDSHIQKKTNNFIGIMRQNFSITHLDFVDDFDLIKSKKHRVVHHNSIEQQCKLKNDYQTIKPSEIVKGRPISEKLLRFEREIAGQVYYLKGICKRGNIKLYYDQVQNMEYWSWLYALYFSAIMDNKSILFDDMKSYNGWLNQRRQFLDEIEDELNALSKIKGVTIKKPKNMNDATINCSKPFEKTKRMLIKVSYIIEGENFQNCDYTSSISNMLDK